ncbi:MAG: CYTH domain-containing protein [Bacteroidota bacterium]
MKEIERKFLVKSEGFKSNTTNQYKITQAYLNSHPNRTVRIRIKNELAFLTIKGKSSEDGRSRFEWEQPIDIKEAMQLLQLCEPGKIKKVRYEVKHDNHLWEIDVFEEQHQGLIIAEIELKDADEDFEKPEWLGKEVTGDSRYYNSQLIQLKKPPQ